MTTKQILEGARDLIRESGSWCQGESHSADGLSHCAWGAIITVERENKIWNKDCCRTPATVALSIVMGAERGEQDLSTVSTFNDSHTHAEVLEAFNLAIADEIAKEEAEFKERLGATMERHSEALELLAA